MSRVTPDSAVRRRLFAPEDPNEEAKVDNLANILQESIVRDRIEKSKKWNFDFENEMPLEGNYEWYKCDTSNWMGLKTDEMIEAKEEDSFYSMKLENEATPKVIENKGAVRTSLKRRLKFVVDKDTRRRLTFQ